MKRLTFTAINSGDKISIPRVLVETAIIEEHPNGAFIIMMTDRGVVWVKEDPEEMLKLREATESSD